MQNYSFDLLGSNRGPSGKSISGFSLYLIPTFKCGVDFFYRSQKMGEFCQSWNCLLISYVHTI